MTAKSPSNAPGQECREAFERWFGEPNPLGQNQFGEHTNPAAYFKWLTWQAAWTARDLADRRADLPSKPVGWTGEMWSRGRSVFQFYADQYLAAYNKEGYEAASVVSDIAPKEIYTAIVSAKSPSNPTQQQGEASDAPPTDTEGR
jgi:hypothetical protein